jgi:hypothetical protein
MFRFARGEKGSILPGAIFGMLSLVSVFYLVGLRTIRSGFSNNRLRDDMAQTQLATGIETMVLAYRLAEVKYIRSVKDCSSAKPFIRALKEGSGCDVSSYVSVFSSAPDDPGEADGLYSYPGPGCTITQSSSTCANAGRRVLLLVENALSAATPARTKYEFRLIAADPAQQVLHMLAVVTPGSPGARSFNNEFAIRTSLPNTAHVESADNRITQQQPDPLSKCKGKPWATMEVYDGGSSSCQEFGQLGGGYGLAFYQGSYFGLRPEDGQVVDVLAVGTNFSPSTYMVAENGTVGGRNAFPPYQRELLMNADDFTVSGGEVAVVSGLSNEARIDLLADSTGTMDRRTICPLGTLGWAQSYAGIAAMSWNEPLDPPPNSGASFRFGAFALKTVTGDFLTAAVVAVGGAYECVVFKDSSLQEVEYKRTLGFDRTDDRLPYYIY